MNRLAEQALLGLAPSWILGFNLAARFRKTQAVVHQGLGMIQRLVADGEHLRFRRLTSATT